jgi:hypothetical protein
LKEWVLVGVAIYWDVPLIVERNIISVLHEEIADFGRKPSVGNLHLVQAFTLLQSPKYVGRYTLVRRVLRIFDVGNPVHRQFQF